MSTVRGRSSHPDSGWIRSRASTGSATAGATGRGGGGDVPFVECVAGPSRHPSRSHWRRPFRWPRCCFGADRTTVRLPDGTEATIAPASRLRVLEGFGEDGRPVELDGLALFSVATDAERPFTVAAHGARVRVVGTRFVVHAYDSASVHVAVEEGIVDIGTAAGAVARLTAGDAMSVEDERLNVRRGTDVEPYTAWTRGRLRFDDVTVADLARELTRWYAVPMVVDDSTLAARRISIEVVEAELDEALRRAALAVGARLTRDGDTVRLESIP